MNSLSLPRSIVYVSSLLLNLWIVMSLASFESIWCSNCFVRALIHHLKLMAKWSVFKLQIDMAKNGKRKSMKKRIVRFFRTYVYLASKNIENKWFTQISLGIEFSTILRVLVCAWAWQRLDSFFYSMKNLVTLAILILFIRADIKTCTINKLIWSLISLNI